MMITHEHIPTDIHDPVVKGTGRNAYAMCYGCASKDSSNWLVVRGPRKYVNRIARIHRKEFSNVNSR